MSSSSNLSEAARAAFAQPFTNPGFVTHPFRLVHVKSGRSLFAQKDKRRHHGVGVIAGQAHPDHRWEAEWIDQERFYLRNCESGRYFHVRHRTVEASPDKPAPGDRNFMWKFALDGGPTNDPETYLGLFRLVNEANQERLFFDERKGTLSVFSAGFDDQLWAVVPDSEVVPCGELPAAAPAEAFGPDSDLDNWELAFDDGGRISADRPKVGDTILPSGWDVLRKVRDRLRTRRNAKRHLFLMIHGVSEDSGGIYGGYRCRMAEMFSEYPDLLKQQGIDPKDVMALRINWKSGTMAKLLMKNVTPNFFGELAEKWSDNFARNFVVPSQTLGETGDLAQVINMLGLADGVHAPTIHLVAHSFGTQVVSYVLPRISVHVKLGSIMLLQGFAASSAFTISRNRTLGDMVPGQKATYFPDHSFKVRGPIIATKSDQDLQIRAAQTLKAMPSAIGILGFEKAGADVKLHDLIDDQIEGGKLTYGFERKSKLYNLEAKEFILDHNDIDSRALVWAQLHAAGLVPAGFSGGRVQETKWPRSGRSDAWMGEMWRTLKRRNLRQITLPGAHDAGASEITDIRPAAHQLGSWLKTALIESSTKTKLLTAGGLVVSAPLAIGMAPVLAVASVGLAAVALAKGPKMMKDMTRTQRLTIGEQLKQGCRYFDMRPALLPKGFHLAHLDQFGSLGWCGGIGEQLDTVLSDIAKFAGDPAHSRELVVLKFSHFASLLPSATKAGLTDAEKTQLLQLITGRLRRQMIARPRALTEAPLDTLPLEDLMKGGRNVLCLFDCDFPKWEDLRDNAPVRTGEDGEKMWKFRKPEEGIFTFGAWDTDADFRLYDDYSDRPNWSGAIGIQKARFNTRMAQRARGRRDGVFLFSWTVTMKPANVVTGSKTLLETADDVNKVLPRYLNRWLGRRDLSGAKLPNILYLDAYSEKFLPFVQALNALRLPSSGPVSRSSDQLTGQGSGRRPSVAEIRKSIGQGRGGTPRTARTPRDGRHLGGAEPDGGIRNSSQRSTRTASGSGRGSVRGGGRGPTRNPVRPRPTGIRRGA